MKTLKMNEILWKKSRGYTNKITHFFAASCPRVAHFALYKKHYLGFDFVPRLED